MIASLAQGCAKIILNWWFSNSYHDEVSLVFPMKCPQVYTTGPHWWYVSFSTYNGLVPSENKPLPFPMLTEFYNMSLSQSVLSYTKAFNNTWGVKTIENTLMNKYICSMAIERGCQACRILGWYKRTGRIITRAIISISVRLLLRIIFPHIFLAWAPWKLFLNHFNQRFGNKHWNIHVKYQCYVYHMNITWYDALDNEGWWILYIHSGWIKTLPRNIKKRKDSN